MCNRLEGIKILIYLIFTTSIQCSYTYFAIEQCPGSNVPNIRHQTEFNEMSLILYYTQWSEESLQAVRYFNDVAEYFGDKMYFAAIDCWHLECNCSKTLSSIIGSGTPHKWPTLIVHYGSHGQLKIQYNGLFTFKDMVQFVMNIVQPLERVERREDLEEMKSKADGIVVGIFINPNCFEYKQYLIASLKWLEYDPIRAYRFTVAFVNVDEKFYKIELKEPNILLVGHKTVKSFTDYSNYKWNASNILGWLRQDFKNEHSILHGYSTPIAIAEKIKQQPVLAVFVNEPQQFFSYMEKYVDKKKPFTKVILNCKSADKRKAMERNWNETLRIYNIVENLLISGDNLKCPYHRDIVLKNLNYYYEINQHYELYQKQHNSAKTSLYYKPNWEVHELLSFFQSTTCLLKKDIVSQNSLHISIVKRLEVYLGNEQQHKNSNLSLSVVLLDTQRYKDFLEHLDISPTFQSMATVFIIDNDKESIYEMEDRFAMFNLMEFVKKYYSNFLNNYYKEKKNIPSRLGSSGSSLSPRVFDIELKQLSRYVFLNHLQYTHNQTLVVLIYSPDCALCGNMQHSFLQLSLSLRSVVELKFIRINIMDNDLPWHLNMPFLPALLVFPENRFSESRLFPTHLKPDIRNLFGFILCQMPARQQVRLALVMCQSGTLAKNHSQSCWQFAKTILMHHIGKHLQYWQMFEAERSIIFEHLRAFKDMSLDIQRNLRL